MTHTPPFQSKRLALFGCCLWLDANGHPNSTPYNGRPSTSPHGSLRVVVPINRVFEARGDYLLPLKGANENDRLVQSRGGTSYFYFLYVKAADLTGPTVRTNYETWLWLQQWRLDRHPYLKLEGQAEGGGGFVLVYNMEVLGRRVWYNIWTPYTTEFGNEVEWERIDRQDVTSVFFPEITQPMTADVARQIQILRE